MYVYIKDFNLWYTLHYDCSYHYAKNPIDFWYRQNSNPKSLIQRQKTC